MIAPDDADHATEVLVVPETEALNCLCCPGASTTEAGLTETAIAALGATCNWDVLDTPLSAAVIVTAWAVLALLTLTWKPTLLDPAGTVTDAGADTAALADDVLTLTTTPPEGEAPDNDTVHADDAGTVIDEGLQVRPDRDGAGAFPVMLMLLPAAVKAMEVPSGVAAAAFVSWTAAV